MERILFGSDWFGNRVCGDTRIEDFPCTMWPNHDGPCRTECQSCGNDWGIGKCPCAPRCGRCSNALLIESEIEEGLCGYCMLDDAESALGYCGHCLMDEQASGQAHSNDCAVRPVTPTELAETLRSLRGP